MQCTLYIIHYIFICIYFVLFYIVQRSAKDKAAAKRRVARLKAAKTGRIRDPDPGGLLPEDYNADAVAGAGAGAGAGDDDDDDGGIDDYFTADADVSTDGLKEERGEAPATKKGWFW